MTKIFLALGLIVALACSSARAASVTVTPGTTAGGNDLFEFFLDTTGSAGTFDTFELVVQSAGLFNQVGAAGTVVAQPSEDSGFSQFLTAPSNFGGLALSAFGIVDTTSVVSGTHASLGSNGASTQGDYWVAQVVLPTGTGGSFAYSFFDDGTQTSTGSGNLGVIPEPASLVMAFLGLLGMASARRRS